MYVFIVPTYVYFLPMPTKGEEWRGYEAIWSGLVLRRDIQRAVISIATYLVVIYTPEVIKLTKHTQQKNETNNNLLPPPNHTTTLINPNNSSTINM